MRTVTTMENIIAKIIKGDNVPTNNPNPRIIQKPKPKANDIPEIIITDEMTESEKKDAIKHNLARQRLLDYEKLTPKEKALRCLLFEEGVRKNLE